MTKVRDLIPMPKMSDDGVPCWPDYRVWLINDSFYEPSECHNSYCHKPEIHTRYMRCLADTKECKTVCARCHRGVCYEKEMITWLEGSASVEIQTPPLKPFSRPHISDGPISFTNLLKDAVPMMPELEILKAINTSVQLYNLRDDIKNITNLLLSYGKDYDEISAKRISLVGWFSGFVSNTMLWPIIALILTWLSVGSFYIYFRERAQGGTGKVVMRRRGPQKGYKRL